MLVIQRSGATKDLVCIHVFARLGVFEILPPFGRLNDNRMW